MAVNNLDGFTDYTLVVIAQMVQLAPDSRAEAKLAYLTTTLSTVQALTQTMGLHENLLKDIHRIADTALRVTETL